MSNVSSLPPRHLGVCPECQGMVPAALLEKTRRVPVADTGKVKELDVVQIGSHTPHASPFGGKNGPEYLRVMQNVCAGTGQETTCWYAYRGDASSVFRNGQSLGLVAQAG